MFDFDVSEVIDLVHNINIAGNSNIATAQVHAPHATTANYQHSRLHLDSIPNYEGNLTRIIFLLIVTVCRLSSIDKMMQF